MMFFVVAEDDVLRDGEGEGRDDVFEMTIR